MSSTGPTLAVLAAGMGRRYGGLKQIDRFGPSGETLLDYAVYDALVAGFAKVVFIIRHDFEADFRAAVGRKYESRLAVDYVFQELDQLPQGLGAPAGRSKPWGTAHAVWCARGCVREPFVCVNADDFYGRASFEIAARHLMQPAVRSMPEYCIVGFPIRKTLSEHGAVARAICEVDEDGFLMGLVERMGVEKAAGAGRYVDETGQARVLHGGEVVSMNMMGFDPSVFEQLDRHLYAFLAGEARTSKGADSDAECLLPSVVGQIVAEGSARVRVLPTTETWFGVTHPQDKPGVVQRIGKLVAAGIYPSPIGPER